MRLRLHRIPFAVGFVLVASLLWSSELRGQDLGNISGQIRLPGGGFLSERILVTLQGRGAIINSSYCDNEGRFAFSGLVANPYYVVIETEGYQPVRQQVIVVPTISQTNLVHIVLSPLPGSTARGSPEGTLGANPNLVDVADFAKKFPPGVRKEFDAGRKAEERGDSAAAVKPFQAALRLAPDFYPARNGLGTQYMRKGDLQAAEREFRQVIAEDPNSAQAYFNLGNALFLTNRNGDAKQTLEAGLRLSPSNALGHYLNGSVLTRLGDFKAAEEQLKTARVLNPKMPQVPISLATLYLQSGREHEAAAMFEAFLRQFPNDPMVPKVRAALTKMAKTSSP
jgi:Flp pilus assembly protein TadD